MSEQTLQFNDRWTAVAFVGGLVALALVGVAGGALFRDSCDELFAVGERATFIDPDPAAVVDDAVADDLVTYGERAGLGPWRGAMALDPSTDVVDTEDGFLLFTPAGIDALAPGLSAVNASRDTEGLRRFVALNGAAVGAVGDPPYEVAVLDEDLALIGCGRVATDEPVLAIDRARAYHGEGDTLSATGLDGDRDWSRTFETGVVGEVEVLLGAALVTTGQAVHLVDVRSGRDLVPPVRVADTGAAPARIVDVGASRALLATASGLHVLDLRREAAPSRVPGEAPAGLLRGEVVTAAALPALPGGLALLDLSTSGATYTILRATRDDGSVVGLLYGPAEPSTG